VGGLTNIAYIANERVKMEEIDIKIVPCQRS
jgi:hypothetical protein